MKPARVELEHRDLKPANMRDVVVVRRRATAGRRKRLLCLLRLLLDSPDTPDEGPR